MKKLALLAPLAAAGIALAGCDGATAEHHDSPSPHPAAKVVPKHVPSSPSTPAKAPQKVTVPTNLVGTTLGKAKTKLAELGFTHVVVGGGQVTDADKVASVPAASKSLAPNAKVVVVGKAPAPAQPASPPAAAAPNSSNNQSGGVQYTCDLNSPVKTDPNHPNEIINRACGYTGSDGQKHSHDPWIEGQMEFNRCNTSGGHWDIPSQSCKH